jgi:FKBP-type peptidyl-prolyl cis-trans isomerase FkpA
VSAAQAAKRPATSGRAVKLWLAFLIVAAAGIGLAWVGAQSVKDRTVQVETIEAGSGPFIAPEDGVMIDYEGRLENGTVFDSSAGKGPVPLLAGQVIPGFTQALGKMQKGGRYRAHIPARLGYGATPPAGAPIPPNADLEFDIHIVQVVPNAALMQQGAPRQ